MASVIVEMKEEERLDLLAVGDEALSALLDDIEGMSEDAVQQAL